jgi:hypothetical protein
MGWLPQPNHLYFLDDAAAASSIATAPYVPGQLSPQDIENVALATNLYRSRLRPRCLPEKYIFVPMQLEYDTVIRHFSPHFKLMNKFLAFLLVTSPLPIVVKNHPKQPNIVRPPGCVVVPSSIPAMDLTAYAEAVVGINSTVLTEALAQYKKVIQFGGTPGQLAMIDGSRFLGRGLSAAMEQPAIPREEINYRLALLLRNQFDTSKPALGLIARLIAKKFECALPAIL